MGAVLTLSGVMLPSSPAFAQNVEVSACRTAMQESWADIVRAPMAGNPDYVTIVDERASVRTLAVPSPAIAPPAPPRLTDHKQQTGAKLPASDPQRPRLEELAQTCSADRLALNDVLLLDAIRSRDLGETDRALALLARMDVRAGERSLGLYFAELLKTHSQAGSIAGVLPDVLERHEALLLAGGMEVDQPFSVQGIDFRSYRLADPQDGWLLIGVHPKSELESILAGLPSWARDYAFEGDRIPFALTNARCSVSSEPFEDSDVVFDANLTLDQIIIMLDRTYADPERNRWGGARGVADFCPNLDEILPGFGPQVDFTGAEYRDRGLGYSEVDLLLELQSEDLTARREATEYLFDHPDAVEPIHFIYGITTLMQQGDMERATFWYYIWQTRTRPWMVGDSNLTQVRSALGATLGPVLLTWSGSDYVAMVDLYRRAIRYELEIALYPGRPDEVSPADWDERVAAAREQNSEQNALSDLPEQQEFETRRLANGLPIGPWQSPGRPLKDEWR
jgi:hypothetical protein